MTKYIDAEKLKEDIQANLAAISFNDDYQEGYEACGMSVLKSIDSLQQEQPDDKLTNIAYWLEHFGMPKENIEKCTTQISQGYGAIRYLEGVQVGAEAVNELAEQEQQEVDLEKELNSLDDAYFDLDGIAVKGATYYLTVEDLKDIARHFYELGKNSK